MEKAATTGHTYKLLLSCPSGLSPAQVSVVFDEAYDRVPHPDIRLEDSIAEIWNQRVQKNASLFNGKKFRYGGHSLPKKGGSDQEPHVCLHLGLTDYRTFVGTNLNPLWEQFLNSSEACMPSRKAYKLHADDCIRCQHTSSPLGNGAVVETSDSKILVLQRSNDVGEFPGYFVFPGGHPEPEEIGVASHQYRKDLAEFELINKNASQEMFDSIIREVVEEIGVPAESLHNPVLIGVSQREMNVRPAAFFYIKCSLNSEEVQPLYSSAQDGYESLQLYAISPNDLETMASKMPGCHRGGFALYMAMIEAMRNI